jgi:short subunit dehydrogenase-like uncharacterized protein
MTVVSSPPSQPWLLYGANGYTGELIAREAVRRGFKPILAGRSRPAIERLAAELGCPSAVFEVDDHTTMVAAVANVAAVLNCAGPFSRTARPVMQACLACHVHYFDIAGEIDIFELARSVDEKAQRASMVLCPGIGFDVVPTDCLALKLKLAMPDATHLALGFEANPGVSKGTAKTMVESAGLGSRIRKDGTIVDVPLASRTRRIDFGGGERLGVGIPWGDIATAYFTTGIPNIEVFSAMSPEAAQRLARTNWLRPLLRRRWVQSLAKFGIDRGITPPSATQRENNATFVWGEVRNAAGETRTARVRTANGYALTITASLGILGEVLRHGTAPGYTTPALLVGPDFVATLPGSTAIRLDS